MQPATLPGRLLTPTCIALLLTACPDYGTDVRIHNPTATSVVVREVGINSGKDIVSTLSAGAVRQSLWRLNSGDRVTVRGEGPTGTVVFCHAYSYQELQHNAATIEIVPDVNDCPSK